MLNASREGAGAGKYNLRVMLSGARGTGRCDLFFKVMLSVMGGKGARVIFSHPRRPRGTGGMSVNGYPATLNKVKRYKRGGINNGSSGN